jgi:hypothetical protein
VGVKDRERKGQEKENSGEPASDLGEHIGRLRSKNILRHAAAEGSAEAFAFRPLHQNHKHHDRADKDIKPEEDVDQKAHWDGQYP